MKNWRKKKKVLHFQELWWPVLVHKISDRSPEGCDWKTWLMLCVCSLVQSCKPVGFGQSPLSSVTQPRREAAAMGVTERVLGRIGIRTGFFRNFLSQDRIAFAFNITERLSFISESHERKPWFCIGRAMPGWCNFKNCELLLSIVQYSIAGMLQDLGTMVIYMIITVMIPHTQLLWCRFNPLVLAPLRGEGILRNVNGPCYNKYSLSN